MKNLLFALLATALLRCTNDKTIEPADELAGTQWSTQMFQLPNGKYVYKVLKFIPGKQVKISYQIDKGQIYFDVGTLKYDKQGFHFWVLNANNTRTDGEIVGDHMKFGDDEFNKEP